LVDPENWRKGERPSGKAGAANGSATPSQTAGGNNGRSNGNGSNGNGTDLDKRISALEESVGGKLYRWVLREYGHANKPHLVRDIQQKKKILDVLESATRGLRRMEVVLDRIPEQEVGALLAKLQAPPLNEIADMPTLVQVVQGLEGIVNNGSHPTQPDRLSSPPHTGDAALSGVSRACLTLKFHDEQKDIPYWRRPGVQAPVSDKRRKTTCIWQRYLLESKSSKKTPDKQPKTKLAPPIRYSDC